ncbi:hypothetical protein CAL7716_046110 [Calothrix sp. PCC 7716]|nr:hypothetical protein CAL7716_046110 [Calothrix sp. PCC 7716]
MSNYYEIFENQLPERLKAELDSAKKLGVKPIKIGEPGFDAVINEGTIKWAVTTNRDLVVIPYLVGSIEVNHTVLTNGEPVLAAGDAEIAGHEGQYFMISISNRSGHYQPSPDSLNIGMEAFKERGIDPTDADKIIEG